MCEDGRHKVTGSPFLTLDLQTHWISSVKACLKNLYYLPCLTQADNTPIIIKNKNVIPKPNNKVKQTNINCPKSSPLALEEINEFIKKALNGGSKPIGFFDLK